MPYYYIDQTREGLEHTQPDVGIYFEQDQFLPDAKGFYYGYGSPGCLPDSGLFGPYDTEQEALAAARESSGFCAHGLQEFGPVCKECPALEL